MKLFKLGLYLFIGLLATSVLFVSFTHLVVYIKSQKGTEVTLQVSGGNSATICTGGWKGEDFCPSGLGFSYRISRVGWDGLDTSLQDDIGNSYDSFLSFVRSHPGGAVVYVPLVQDEDGTWYFKGVITTNRQNISSPVFIKGFLDGSGTTFSHTGIEEVIISYPYINTSFNLASLVDFNYVSTKRDDFSKVDNTLHAVIVLDKDGNAHLKAFKVGNKVCISVWQTVNIENKDCWTDWRNSRSGDKKYNSFLSFPIQLVQEIIYLF